MRSTTITPRRLGAATAAAALLLAACGGSDDAEPADEPAEESVDEPADDTGADDTGADADDANTGDEAIDEPTEEDGSGTYEPGGSSFRTVNLLDRPVDIYVRTTGFVEAFPVETGVEPGAVTEFASPPEDGLYLITEAGAGDPTCVIDCDHFIAEASDPIGGNDPFSTIVLYEDTFSERSAGFTLREDPNSDSPFGAGIAAPDPATGLVIPVGIALDEDQFGLKVGYEGVEGCVPNVAESDILVGGNQTEPYAYPGDAAGVLFFELADENCESPAGGPFEVDGGPGTRTFVILTGSAGSLEAIVLDLVDPSDPDASTASDDDGAGGDGAGDDAAPEGREEFVEALLEDAPEGTDAQCVADVVDQLSDADIAVIIENIDAEDVPPELSPEGLETLAGILDCAPA